MTRACRTRAVSVACLMVFGLATETMAAGVVLQNERVGLVFDRDSGSLRAIENRLTQETYRVEGDEFAVEAVEFRLGFADAKLASLEPGPEALKARYQGGAMTVDVTYTLRRDSHFAEKTVVLTSSRDCGLKKVLLSRPTFSADGLKIVSYRHPKFMRPAGTEPICTFFGRTARGGFFAGVEMPFDASSAKGQQVVLAYSPSLKVRAGEAVPCEPVYLGVYRRLPGEQEKEGLPLQSESDAMVAMTSAILGPPRHGPVPMACGWHSEMEQFTYRSEEVVREDMKSLDFLAECGIDWLSDSHPWAGETQKMNALTADQKYVPGDLVQKFLRHAQRVGVKVVMWPTMNNTHPWSGEGRPFRSDKPEWLLTAPPRRDKPDLVLRAKANCFANTPFFDWLSRVNMDGLATGYYKSWAMDGSFFGDGGWYTTIIPVDCSSDKHDHLPGDSNYACQRALDRLIAQVRRRYPDMYIFVCRPPMDLGVWSLRNVDACFTLLESGTGASNVAAGDNIRTWSRVRVHHNFFPHYLDQPLAFPSRAGRNAPPNWPSAKLDYILLSALSCSPNQLYYLPTKTGIPAADKAQIRKWLDWGRRNVECLKVRKDLPDWPASGRVDGSAHVVGDRGLVFLFNSGKTPLSGSFALTEADIGLKGKGMFQVVQEYPQSGQKIQAAYGGVVRWDVPAETALVLRITPAGQ